MRPRVGSSKPAIIRSTVVLPDPDGPSNEKNSPGAMSRSMPATASTSPNVFRKPRRSMAAVPSCLFKVTVVLPAGADVADHKGLFPAGEWAIDQASDPLFVRSYSRPDVRWAMELRLSDILADPELGLTLVDGSPGALARHVRWVAVTELADPRPFLSGGELVLTTGLAQRTAAAQREFVTRIAACDVAGLGFGTRLTHNVVPAATLAAARAAGLPVLEVPYSTPFIAVDRFAADRILEEQYGRYHDLVVEQDTLARSLLSGRGLGALVESLQRILGAAVMVVDQQDNVLAGSLLPGAEVTVLPVEIEDRVVAYLRCGRPQRSSDVLPYAIALVGLELSRREAVLAGRRQLAGQVLEDLVRGSITTAEAERRLATFGIRAGDEHALVVGTLDLTGEDLRRQLAVSPILPGATTAVLEDCLVA